MLGANRTYQSSVMHVTLLMTMRIFEMFRPDSPVLRMPHTPT